VAQGDEDEGDSAVNVPHTPIQARRESGDERRAAIAAAARALIVEKGMAGLRMRDIAERVGINIATLHYHVPSKAALVRLVVETLIDDFRAQPMARPRAQLPPAALLEHEFADFYEAYIEHPEIGRLMEEFLNLRQRDADIRAAIDPMQSYWTRMIADILAAGRADGCFRADLDPDAAAQMLTGALINYSHHPTPSAQAFGRLTAELRRAIANPLRLED
jgi:AcrR family transcriptional regulator